MRQTGKTVLKRKQTVQTLCRVVLAGIKGEYPPDFLIHRLPFKPDAEGFRVKGLSFLLVILFASCLNEKENSSNAIPPPKAGYACDQAISEQIARTLRALLANDLARMDSTDRTFSYDTHDMNGDGLPEYVVAMPSGYLCGSGGCLAYILNADMSVLSRFTTVVFPVYVSTRDKTNEYFDLYIQSQGAYHILKFDRHRYPSNPVSQPVIDLQSYVNRIELLKHAYEEKCPF